MKILDRLFCLFGGHEWKLLSGENDRGVVTMRWFCTKCGKQRVDHS